MSEETTTPEVKTTPVYGEPNVEARVDYRLKLHDLLEKYTRAFKDKEDYEQLKTSFAIMVKGLYEARKGDLDAGRITIEDIFEQAWSLWPKPGEPEKVEPTPPKGERKPGMEGGETITSGHESFSQEDFPLHDNDTWLRVRTEHRRKLKTLKTNAEARGVVSSILESLAKGE